MNLVYGLAVHEVSVAQVIRAPARCLGGHRFESCRGLRFFLLTTLVTCWIFHFHICVTSLKIYFLSLFHQKCFARSGKQSNIQFEPCWEAPPTYLWLVMYWQLSSSDQYGNLWAQYKNTGSYSRLSLPFSFLRFSSLPLPFLHQPRLLFSFALLFASILSCFLLPWLL